MFEKLDEVDLRFEQIQAQLQEPGIADNQKRFRELMKELADLEDLVATYREYKAVQKQLTDNKGLLQTEKDEELRELVKDELAQLEQRQEELAQKLKILLIPKDPNDEKNIILEVRAGAGGDEASLFAEQLFRAYCLFAADHHWRVQVISTSPGNVGGYKEAIASISGDKVFSKMKYESGVHRVQRVPRTESQGRVHTSTITVAVIPEAEEVEVKLNPNDIRVDVFRSGGHGGQSVNTTDSAVRVTHLPTNTVVICQDGKSQLANKEQALKVLYSRLLAAEKSRAQKEASDQRLAQIGTGDRSERIRTYNFPQSRVTDHRIGLTVHQIDEILGGALEVVIDPLITYFQAEALKRQM